MHLPSQLLAFQENCPNFKSSRAYRRVKSHVLRLGGILSLQAIKPVLHNRVISGEFCWRFLREIRQDATEKTLLLLFALILIYSHLKTNSLKFPSKHPRCGLNTLISKCTKGRVPSKSLLPTTNTAKALETGFRGGCVHLFIYLFLHDQPGADQIQQQFGCYQRLCFPAQAADWTQDAVLLVVRSVILPHSSLGHFVICCIIATFAFQFCSLYVHLEY